ncbi:23S rRNA pseudouridine(1911/1915/1917) synthase RluD [Coxiella endosymbiont of Amblyomma sculptum]|uniref:23S rRNA pseudouridine(1911/1915/1917) synthase RluD n=1 Tax=Coxiella endosymbiont of Amblyomma sculptum TaxID=2487929 RepID=UPI00132E7A35|nr:23S rRNA pseudouridine(1911/1915/1917) synthase RluD [Coxiella endosymbiont of Amblyomma sculptum]QHG92376.1 23S rRNA pseudouridine(1911/1915/1917) synthase RluD [Coxiella endosymbiont of Amblyomma sculptum]
MNRQKIFLRGIVPKKLTGIRLDQTLAKLFPNYSRSQLQNWIRAGYVYVNGTKKTLVRETVQNNQSIEIIAYRLNQDRKRQVFAQELPLNVLYEDESLLIIDKPPGLTVHPGAGIPDCTLIDTLLHRNPQMAALPRSGIVHRLDKDTSGLLVIARSLTSYHLLIKAIQTRKIVREYEAIVKGTPISGQTIRAPIGRHPVNRTRMSVVSDGGREATTHFRILQRYKAHTHVRIRLETGRTHQIRVHMNYIRHPLIGDQVYGGRLSAPSNLSDTLRATLQAFRRQALHATTLKFSHPLTQKIMEWHSPLPQDILNLLESLSKNDIYASKRKNTSNE